MARTAEAAARQRRNRLRRQRANGPAGVDLSWQKMIRCHICDKPYVCNNYPDRKARSRHLFGVRCCPTCFYKVGPAIQRLVELKKVKVRKNAEEERTHQS